MSKVLLFLFVIFIVFSGSVLSEQLITQEDNRVLETYEIQYGDVESLGLLLEQMKSNFGKVTPYGDRSVIIVYDVPEVQGRIAKLIKELDIPHKQVLINVLLAETSVSLIERAGLISSGTAITPDDFNRIKYILKNDKNTIIRNEMSVRTLSGKPAKLQVSSEEFFPGEVYFDEGYTIVTPYRERKAGSFLDVLPRVNKDNTVNVQVSPSRSEFTGQYSSSESSIGTQVIIGDGDTIYLGGLNSSSHNIVQNNIPFTGINTANALDSNRSLAMFLTVEIDKQ
ncbi:MAG: hypothetical protein HQL29_00060 [Candidatus Omnitrophica bacterium]|nr:hypothetical protein [Candidatus Omnitrophota bacterium]